MRLKKASLRAALAAASLSAAIAALAVGCAAKEGQSHCPMVNIVNGGIVAADGDDLYISAIGYGKVFKVGADGEVRTLLDEAGLYLSVDGGFLYMSGFGVGGALLAVDLSTLEKHILTDHPVEQVHAYEGHLYYIGTADRCIYRMRAPSGGPGEKVVDQASGNLNVYGGRLYYVNLDEGGRIYTSRLDGKGRGRVCDGSLSIYGADPGTMVVAYGSVYFRNGDDGGRLYSFDLEADKAAPVRVTETPVLSINVAGRQLLYSTFLRRYDLHVVNADGSRDRAISKDESWYVNVMGGYVYYISPAFDYSMFKIGIEGGDTYILRSDGVFEGTA
ncbi:MAG: DUF5050 domain-containing protein [Oscillospiraceae bacterium]|nr:DUF5050 domain-containing protein [Oscillospiraceae bacterium]